MRRVKKSCLKLDCFDNFKRIFSTNHFMFTFFFLFKCVLKQFQMRIFSIPFYIKNNHNNGDH